jgi:hypothetical protein
MGILETLVTGTILCLCAPSVQETEYSQSEAVGSNRLYNVDAVSYMECGAGRALPQNWPRHSRHCQEWKAGWRVEVTALSAPLPRE